jgi:hypothetical protein
MKAISDNAPDLDQRVEGDPLAEAQGVLFDERPDEANPDQEATPAEPRLRVEFRQDLPTIYVVILTVASVTLVLSSALGFLSWLVPIVAIPSLGASLFEGGSRLTLAGGAVLVLIVALGAFDKGEGESSGEPTRERVEVTSVLNAPAPVSLGIFLSDLAEQWNVVDSPPKITKGFTRYAESGEYDSFLYRFGDWGRLAGAYDPSTDAVHALLATGQFSNDATSRLAPHLCFVLQPYSAECLDAYTEQGLDDGDLEDFAGVDHEAEWTLDSQTWRLSIQGNVLTIRVLSPEAD